jgi:hypothetical protein
MNDRGASESAGRERRVSVTDPEMNDVLRDAGFEITDAGRERWRRQLATPIPQEALDEGQRMLDQARGRAA